MPPVTIEADRPTPLFASFLFRGAGQVPMDQLEAWVDAVPLAERFYGYQRHPVPAGRHSPDDAYVAVQIPAGLLGDAGFDLIKDVGDEVREGILAVLGHRGGDHRWCSGLFDACAERPRQGHPCRCEVPDASV